MPRARLRSEIPWQRPGDSVKRKGRDYIIYHIHIVEEYTETRTQVRKTKQRKYEGRHGWTILITVLVVRGDFSTLVTILEVSCRLGGLTSPVLLAVGWF